MKKPSLAQSLKNFQKAQVEKAKQERRNTNSELKRKNVESGGGSGGGNGAKKDAKMKKDSVKTKTDEPSHVPCHIWTDGPFQVKTATPFHPNAESVVLLCGEGDFSFCRALAGHFQAKNPSGSWFIVASALDSQVTVKQKYRKASENLAALSAEFGDRVACLFDTDATKLHENKEIKRLLAARSASLTRIIFNFPHTGAGIKDRERNIVAQQRLLSAFFASVSKLVSLSKPEKSCTYQTTMIKQHVKLDQSIQTKKSSVKEDDNDDEMTYSEALAFSSPERFQCLVTLKTGDPYDAWNIKSVAMKASNNQLTCQQSFRFLPSLYAGYQHCRTIGEHQGDLQSKEYIDADGWKEFLAGKPAKTYVFEFK